MDEKGWFREPARHSLASRGIRTRAISNPVASPKWKPKYSSGHHDREFIGSGLESLDKKQIIDWAKMFTERINQIASEKKKYSDDMDIKLGGIYVTGSRVAGFHNKYSDVDIILLFHNIPLHHVWEVEDIMDYVWDYWDEKDWVDDFYLVDDDGKKIRVDVVGWGDSGEPAEDESWLKIWEAS